MAAARDKPLMRNIGEFFGHIVKAVRTPADPREKRIVSKKVEEEDRGDIVLRRTTIEEVEIKKAGDAPSPPPPPEP
jgi:hypothetical protein